MMGSLGVVPRAVLAALGAVLVASQGAHAQEATPAAPVRATASDGTQGDSPPQPAPQPLALVVEADLDSLALRAAIAEGLDRPLTTLSRAQVEPGGPSAVLTVSVDPEVGISVMLWERGVGTEILSAPAPKDMDTIRAAATLAISLVQRVTREQRASAQLEANPYLRRLPKAAPPRPQISPVNPYYRARPLPPPG